MDVSEAATGGVMEENAEPLDTISGTGFVNPAIMVNGISITVPMDYVDLNGLRLSVESELEVYPVNPDE